MSNDIVVSLWCPIGIGSMNNLIWQQATGLGTGPGSLSDVQLEMRKAGQAGLLYPQCQVT